MRLLDHLRLSHKFFILGGLALAMMAIPAGLQLRSMGAQMQQLGTQARAMPALQQLGQSVRLTQVHRGLSAGQLGGDAQLAGRRPAVRDAPPMGTGPSFAIGKGAASDAGARAAASRYPLAWALVT